MYSWEARPVGRTAHRVSVWREQSNTVYLTDDSIRMPRNRVRSDRPPFMSRLSTMRSSWRGKSLQTPRRLLGLYACAVAVRIAILLLAGLTFAITASQHAAAQRLNPIQQENGLPGMSGWNTFTSNSQPDALSGFGSKISVNHGDSLDFYVTTTAASFTMDIYRTGYYQGIGARPIQSLGSFTGMHQAIPSPDPVTGMIPCSNWTKTTTLQIPSTWVTGVYLAKVSAWIGGLQKVVSRTSHIF
jgi:N,N-dimethylformamidase beta subunit-like protein